MWLWKVAIAQVFEVKFNYKELTKNKSSLLIIFPKESFNMIYRIVGNIHKGSSPKRREDNSDSEVLICPILIRAARN